VTLLDVDSGHSTNRTVYTFVGSPEAVINGAINGAKVAYNLIDMRKHRGEHKRLGALDVCPFIPVQGVEMEECIYCARVFSERLAQELNVPVFLYGYASVQPHRQTVPQIRAGEYEGLSEKLKQKEWRPDYGPDSFVPSWGATIAGARKFLLAYNVNLISTKEQAHKIALHIREQGSEGRVRRLKQVQAAGWFLKESNIAQVTINLLDYEVTSLHTAFEQVSEMARELSLPVVGSQIVGLIPLKPMLMAAEYYIEKENLFVLEEDQKINLVINRLGLNSLGPFNPKERIIEYVINDEASVEGQLLRLSVSDFIKSVGDRTTAPGGGSVAAAVGALGCALSAMVAKLSYGKKSVEEKDPIMRRLIPIFHEKITVLGQFIDGDTNAYADYLGAMRLPKETPEEVAVRDAAIEAGIKNAINVPLNLARNIDSLWEPCTELAAHINISSASDLEVGVNCLRVGVLSAFYNVTTNLKDSTDESFCKKTREEIDTLLSESDKRCQSILDTLKKRK
jgi:glutamate formiminotransferase/formiminotetrahydrofolate cyclodeaminase